MTDDGDRLLLEICCDSPAGVAAAIAGGADRIELCSALEIGGLTPSAGLTETAIAAARAAGIAVFAMVRPRGGDFTYDVGEIAVAVAEARALIAAGIDGLVFGAVRDGRIDEAACGAWMDAVRIAGPALPCTFHRAIDVIDDPVAAVEQAAALGFRHILTSGGTVRAIDGAVTIAAMAARARTCGISIIAGSGVTPDMVETLVAQCGVRAVHASASRALDAPDRRLLDLGFAAGPRRETDTATVAALRSRLDKVTRIRQ